MLARIIISMISASIFYFGWLALFLLSVRLDMDFAEAIVWTLAPAVTAAGFTAGLLMAAHRDGGAASGGGRPFSGRRASFAAVYPWPLAGCVLGTAVLFWLGAMFIFAGMLLGGAVAMTVREVLVRGRPA